VSRLACLASAWEPNRGDLNRDGSGDCNHWDACPASLFFHSSEPNLLPTIVWLAKYSTEL
jgi:hypothetical protein